MLVPNPAGAVVVVGVAVAVAPVSVATTGQTVVVMEKYSVVTCPSLAGQLVTVAAQDVIV